MLLYRVIPYLKCAELGRAGHPLFINPAQVEGRLDNSDRYLVYYFSREPSGAVGEKFGRRPHWMESMFACPEFDGGVCSLVTYWLPDCVPLLDLDNAANLHSRGMRPTQVVDPNRPATQGWVRQIFDERNGQGERTWVGVVFWSSQGPCWRIVGYWGQLAPSVMEIEALEMGHPAVVDAGRSLGRLHPAAQWVRQRGAPLESKEADGDPETSDGASCAWIDSTEPVPQAPAMQA